MYKEILNNNSGLSAGKLLTTNDVSRLFGLNPQTIYSGDDCGKIESIKLDTPRRFKSDQKKNYTQKKVNNNLTSLGRATSRGGDMKITNDGTDRKTGKMKYKLDLPIRINGKATHIKRTALGSNDLQKKIAELQELADSSLTDTRFPTLGECIDTVILENGGAGMLCTYNKINRDIGEKIINKQFIADYYAYMQKLKAEGKSTNTISNYKGCIRRSLNFALERGKIDSVPIKSWDIEHEYRDKVWTPDERKKIFDKMVELNSHLFWPVYFAERNPIRKADLFNLKEENLVLVGRGAPYIRYRPSKTKKKKQRDAYLVEIDEKLLNYFMSIRPKGTPYLFPYTDRFTGEVKKMGNPKRHWNTICREAGVEDMHIHDLKHCAVTYMLNIRLESGINKFTKQDLKDLGIQYSDKAIEVYYNSSSEAVLDRISGESEDHPLVAAMNSYELPKDLKLKVG